MNWNPFVNGVWLIDQPILEFDFDVAVPMIYRWHIAILHSRNADNYIGYE